MRSALATLALLVVVQSVAAQDRVVVDVFAIGTVDKITDRYIVVNCLSGEAMAIDHNSKTKVIIDGLTCEFKDLKRGMKVRVEGNTASKVAYTINCYVKDPLPRGK
jgi:hypothetical protein